MWSIIRMRANVWADKCAQLTSTANSLERDCYRPAVAILQPLSSHCAFIPRNKNSALFKIFIFTFFFKTCMCLIIRNLTLFDSESVCMGLIVQLSSAHSTDKKISTGSCQVHVTVGLLTGVVISYSDDILTSIKFCRERTIKRMVIIFAAIAINLANLLRLGLKDL